MNGIKRPCSSYNLNCDDILSRKKVKCMSITIRCLAHASFQIKTEKKVIYIDPSTKYMKKLKPKNLEKADLILVTHNHADHCDPGMIKQIRKLGSPIIAPENCRDALKGFIWSVHANEFFQLDDGVVVRAVHAYNVKRFRPSGEPFHPKGFGVGYIITINGKRIYHAGDTDLIPEMEVLGEIDVALLPSGDTYTMDMDEASEAALLIEPKVAIPMHVKDADSEVFRSKVQDNPSIKVVLLEHGEEFTLD